MSGISRTAHQGGSDHTLDYMKARGLPLTRETYLGLNDLHEPLTPELEQMLPAQFQKQE